MAYYRNPPLPPPPRQSFPTPTPTPSPNAPAPPSDPSMAFMGPLRVNMAMAASQNRSAGEYTEELWQACAGPLVSVPKRGQRVWYFPQGHLEQVAASTQAGSTDQQMPQYYQLSPQILCRVVNVILSAESETDEVYAQLSLLPEGDQTSNLTPEKEEPPSPPKPPVRMFTKILTASDTSTHGGFSVLRKHAEECLPLLDMNQETPSQELVATDLHGHEWKFRHTYRGHPRRHLLTTGWSYFVSQKRLVAGDAVIFLRGENGELRVGIRRTKRQHASQSSNVLTSHSMHMGVVATASYAMTTRTMFAVYYKPRVSPSSFIVPVEKFANSMSKNLSVGQRFKMKFETEDASERSFAGTITGIEDMDATSWPGSKWRSLRVNWDELTMHERQDRVSPWEIDLCVSSPTANPAPAPKNKRFRPSSAADSSMSAPSKSESSRVLQGQGGLLSEDYLKAPMWTTKNCDEPYTGDGQGIFRNAAVVSSSEVWMTQQEGRRQDVYRGGGRLSELSSLTSQQQQVMDPLHHLHSHHHQQQGASFYPSFSSPEMAADLKLSVPSTNQITQAWQSASPSSTTENMQNSTWLSSLLPPASSLSNNPQQIAYSPLSPFSPWDSHNSSSITKQDKPALIDNGCKLFGFSLTDVPASAASKSVITTPVNEEESPKVDAFSHQYNAVVETSEKTQQTCKSDASSEQERSDNSVQKSSKESESRGQSNVSAVRSCTKVIMKGMVGRGVDLSKFDCYEKLIEELEAMFHIEGELSNRQRGWQVAYSDNEGDMMHVGDDPWTEFCTMVRKIYIFSPEEVQSAGLPRSPARILSGGKDEHHSERKESPTCSEHRDSSVPALPG